MLVVAWCAPALASNGIPSASEEASDSVPTAAAETASPRLIEKTDTRLHETGVLDNNEAAVKPVESTESAPDSIFAEHEGLEAETTQPNGIPELLDIITRRPAVSNSDLSRFRREMFRTDI